MSFSLAFLLFFILLLGIAALIAFPLIILDSEDPICNSFLLLIPAILAGILAYDLVTNDRYNFSFDDKTGTLNIELSDPEQKIQVIEVNYSTKTKSWKFF